MMKGGRELTRTHVLHRKLSLILSGKQCIGCRKLVYASGHCSYGSHPANFCEETYCELIYPNPEARFVILG